jgi:hypothetical protein
MPPLPQLDDDTATKIATMIRLLIASEGDNALAALGRVLRGGGKDLVDAIAERIARPKMSEADYQAILDEGIRIGRQEARAAQASHPSNGHGPPNRGPQFPSARMMAQHVYRCFDDLNSWEQEFITNIKARAERGYQLYPKQQSKLEDLYLQFGGKLT